MSEVSGYFVAAERRSTRRALRTLLLLGGFIATWWVLMSGVAQADSWHEHRTPADHLRSSAKADHTTPARDIAHRVHHDVKATTSKATERVRREVRPVTRTVAAVVHSTPATSQAAETIRATVSDTVEKTRKVLRDTAAGPVVDTVDEVVKHATEKPQSSTGQGNSPSKHRVEKASANSFAALASTSLDTSGSGSATSAAADLATPSSEAPTNGPRGTPDLPPCASPSGSGSTSFAPAGLNEASWLVVPSVVRDLRSWRLARLPGGPAYQPGSSPD